MRRFHNLFAAILVASLIAFPASAASTIMRATVTGIVGPNLGNDASGVFGSPGTDLIGSPFVASFLYDLSLGQRTTTPGVSDELIGGPAIGLSDPLIDTTMTILGTTVHIPTAGHSIFSMAANQFDIYVASPFPSLLTNHVILFLSIPGLAPSLDSNITPLSVAGGEDFQIRTDVAIGSGYSVFAYGQLVGKTFQLERVTSAVPEPETYAMVLAGLGLLGVITWRRKQGLAA